MDEGERWAVETFGEKGLTIRRRIPEMVFDEQAASADAQDASGHRSRSVFGQFWQGMLEKFEEFGSVRDGTLPHPGRAPYRVPVVNNVVIFPWRYGDGRQGAATSTPFATSNARGALFDLGPLPVQEQLDLDLPEDESAQDDDVLTALVREVADSSEEPARKVVVVAIACSPNGVTDITWGDVRLDATGRLEFAYSESLLHLAGSRPTPVADSTRTFLAGEPPSKDLRLQGEPDGSEIAADDDE